MVLPSLVLRSRARKRTWRRPLFERLRCLAPHLSIGRRGERLAERHLKSKGFTIVARNYRCKLGELDIVARDAKGLVVAEVKTVTSIDHADAGDRATQEKWRRVFRATQHFLQAKNLVHASVRFDLITVLLARGEEPVIEHFEGAWEA